MKTIIHQYSFNIRNESEKAQYNQLKADLKALGLECFESHGADSHYSKSLDGQELTLEAEHLFSNQWNTAPVAGISDIGLRVFDWAQDYRPYGNASLKRGHWLEQTPEMAQARNSRLACGYTGKQITDSNSAPTFNLDTLGSEYLEEKDLHLIRFWPITAKADRPALTQSELDYLLPLYREAQMFGRTERDKERIAQQRAKIASKRNDAIEGANTEFEGFTWLMNRGIKTDNVIYYHHTAKFSVGWRNPLSNDVADELETALKGFPFPIEFKRQ